MCANIYVSRSKNLFAFGIHFKCIVFVLCCVCVCAFSLFVPSIWFLLVNRGEREIVYSNGLARATNNMEIIQLFLA